MSERIIKSLAQKAVGAFLENASDFYSDINTPQKDIERRRKVFQAAGLTPDSVETIYNDAAEGNQVQAVAKEIENSLNDLPVRVSRRGGSDNFSPIGYDAVIRHYRNQ